MYMYVCMHVWMYACMDRRMYVCLIVLYMFM